MADLVLPNGHGHGWRPDTPDVRDLAFRKHFRSVKVPTVVMLDPRFLPPVRDQGQLGSCTGHGTTGAMMWSLRKRGVTTMLSALDAYYEGRVIEACVPEDSGCEIRDVVKALAQTGVTTQDLWPYDVARFAEEPPPVARAARADHKIMVGYYRCNGVSDVLQALARGMPVVGGFSCYSSLDSDACTRTGRIPYPKKSEKLEGGHCVWFVGADQKRKLLKLQNSWSTDWGDQGYGYLPFRYLETGLADDFWALQHE